ncbi:aquaporin [Streptomyces sp. TR06-5]|uniref:aquaporin n=1 Tax=unclassified Streptomyces TaxID=2593676 RepID=UPI0039A118B9
MRARILTMADPRPLMAECLGTLLLVFTGVGAAVVAGEYVGSLGIALAFGLTMIGLARALGALSGSQLDPAVTLGMLIARRIDGVTAIRYWVAQLVGAILGALLLFLVAHQIPGLRIHDRFGTNGFGDRSAVGLGTFGALVAEVVLTFLLVYVWLSVTRSWQIVGGEGVPIGLTLAAVHLVGIPLTGASVNPARSLAPALFAGGAALTQVWLFLVAPLIGGALAAPAHRLVTRGWGEPGRRGRGAPAGGAPGE